MLVAVKSPWLLALLGGLVSVAIALFKHSTWLLRSPALVGLFAKVLRYAIGRRSAMGRGQPQQHQGQAQQSAIKTKFFAMSLDHDSGELNGLILCGEHQGSYLTDLNLSQLLNILDTCKNDANSLNVLTAYLDRYHEGWQPQKQHAQYTAAGEEMDQATALMILGLEGAVTKDQIISAHRRLMQKIHPDRGGSNYLAVQINQAKAFLLQQQ
ncbi:MAG: hypothetical protein KUG79_00440 [Pseudomonadales bacterium]|nr:hypothetical protein [Pseudomonadales bacterium]